MDIALLLKNRAIHAIVAGINYGTALFGAGFAFGVLRTLFVTPWIGRENGILVELPFMFVTAWVACHALLRVWSIESSLVPRLAMSFAAFVIGMGFEFGLSAIVQDQTLIQIFVFITAQENRVGLIGQLLVFLFPVIQLHVKVRPLWSIQSQRSLAHPRSLS